MMMIMNSFEKKNHLTKILIPISIKALYNINHEDNHEEFFFSLAKQKGGFTGIQLVLDFPTQNYS